jgi:hypothetical protein
MGVLPIGAPGTPDDTLTFSTRLISATLRSTEMKHKAITTLIPSLALLLASGHAGATCRMTIAGDPSTVKTVDVPPAGPSIGDLIYMTNPLRDGNVLIGHVEVRHEIIVEPTSQAQDLDGMEERDVTLVFRLGSNNLGGFDTLIAKGVEFIPPATGPQLQANVPQSHALIGGTGRFKFARGQQTSTRMPDGTYQNDFEIYSSASTCNLKRYHQ